MGNVLEKILGKIRGFYITPSRAIAPPGIRDIDAPRCVTGDTLLKRRRRRRVNETWEDYWENLRIDQIREGDQILTLDETTGRFVLSVVKELIDMGIQQTYLLITQTGKQIRTTANHPYLTRAEEDPAIVIGGTYQIDQSPRIEDLTKDSFIAIANETYHCVLQISRDVKKQLSQRYNKRNQRKFFAVDLFIYAIRTILSETKLQPGTLIIDREYPGFDPRIRQCMASSSPHTSITIASIGHTRASYAHWAAYRAFSGKARADFTISTKKDRGILEGRGLGIVTQAPLSLIRNARDLIDAAYHLRLDISSITKWEKVYQLAPGMAIATVDGWERIVVLKPYATEHVYDIQVAGTHNFLGNHIVAHNTIPGTRDTDDQKSQQKIRLSADSLTVCEQGVAATDLSKETISEKTSSVKGVDPRGIAPLQQDLTDPLRHLSGPTPDSVYQTSNQQPTTNNPQLFEPERLLPQSRRQKTTLVNTKKSAFADLVRPKGWLVDWLDTLRAFIPNNGSVVNRSVDSPGVEPGRLGVSSQPSQPAEPTPPISIPNAHQQTTNNPQRTTHVSAEASAKEDNPSRVRPAADSLACPACGSTDFVRRGLRKNRREHVQLYRCSSCHKTFTARQTTGKHFPLAVILDALAIYHLGYSLDQTCALVQTRTGTAIAPSSLADWISEHELLCRYGRFRSYGMKLYSPKDVIVTATLAHRQLYRYRFHRAKTTLIIRDDVRHRRFTPLQEFLSLIPSECPHQYFQDGLRASEAPLTFSKTQMIVRGKENYATRLCAFVLQSVKDRKDRHYAIQTFMLATDSVTVATEVPVYITRDDLEHLQTQLGFHIYTRPIPKNDQQKTTLSDGSLMGSTADTCAPRLSNVTLAYSTDCVNGSGPEGNRTPATQIDSLGAAPAAGPLDSLLQNPATSVNEERPISSVLPVNPPDLPDSSSPAEITDLPRLITGHIDLVQIRNGQIHILDYKPRAAKERPIEQLTLYAMALSRLTGLRLFEFKCAWFDETDYFEFYPLHVLHKPGKTKRRRRIATIEGLYKINQNPATIESIRPYREGTSL